MTEKQPKIGLLSSSTEESALAVSLSQLNQIILNAPRWLAARWCIKNHALVLTEYTSKWIKVSLFFYVTGGFLVCIHDQLQASSVLPQYLCRWHTYKLTLIHEVKLLSGDLAEKMLAPNFLQCHLKRVGM